MYMILYVCNMKDTVKQAKIHLILYAITLLGFIKNKLLLHLKYINLEIWLPRIKNAITSVRIKLININ